MVVDICFCTSLYYVDMQFIRAWFIFTFVVIPNKHCLLLQLLVILNHVHCINMQSFPYIEATLDFWFLLLHTRYWIFMVFYFFIIFSKYMEIAWKIDCIQTYDSLVLENDMTYWNFQDRNNLCEPFHFTLLPCAPSADHCTMSVSVVLDIIVASSCLVSGSCCSCSSIMTSSLESKYSFFWQ